MSRAVLHIIATSYSGSSILSLLLNSHPRMRALGEIIHLYQENNGAFCSACKSPAVNCLLNNHVEADHFYGSLFDYYSDCTVLVDSSKILQWTYLAHPIEQDLQHRFLVLSKSPREFAYSWIHHHPADSVERAYGQYFQFYKRQLHLIDSLCSKTCIELTYVTYADMFKDQQESSDKLCRMLDLPLWNTSETKWWNTDSHIIGGNYFAAAQVNDWEGTLGRVSEHYQQRYASRKHQLFYDNAWEHDEEFLEKCSKAEQLLTTPDHDVLIRLKQV